VGPGSGGGHVVVASPPGVRLVDSANGGPSDLRDWLQDRVADRTLPEPTEDTIYVLHFDASIKLTLDDTAHSCVDFDGYHNSVSLRSPRSSQPLLAEYAVTFRCAGYGIDDLTGVASHEIIEASTDPDVDPTFGVAGGYAMRENALNDPFLAGFSGGEVGDLCTELANPGSSLVSEDGFTLQRIWSNQAAVLGHDPCVPAVWGYFNVAVPSGPGLVSLAVGRSTKINLEPFSEDPTAPWAVVALDGSTLMGEPSPALDLSLSTDSASNGSALTLTVKLLRAPSVGYATFFLASTDVASRHVWPGLVVVGR
jgi:hypothetical protein